MTSEIFAPIVIGAVALSIGGLAAAVSWIAFERLEFRKALQRIDDVYHHVDLRDQELLLPFQERIVNPVRDLLTSLGRRFTPVDYVEQTRVKLIRSGKTDQTEMDRFIAMRVLTILAAPLAFIVVLSIAPAEGTLKLMMAALAATALVMLPEMRLNSAVEQREKSIRRQLPDIMDLLVVCVEAGLGFNAAVARTCHSLKGEMADEFSLALGEMRAGSSRAQALEQLADRVRVTEISSFVGAIKQADKFGISIARVLRQQAEEMRVRRRQIAQENAQKAAVKMLLPMVGFIFPPMFLVVIGPAGLQITQSGGL